MAWEGVCVSPPQCRQHAVHGGRQVWQWMVCSSSRDQIILNLRLRMVLAPPPSTPHLACLMVCGPPPPPCHAGRGKAVRHKAGVQWGGKVQCTV